MPTAVKALGISEPAFSDRLGEFAISTLLGAWLNPLRSSRAAAGWGGDKLSLYLLPESRFVLVWETSWDSIADAEEFTSALRDAYGKRFSAVPAGGVEKMVFSDTPWGAVEVSSKGKLVSVVIGNESQES